MQKLFTKFPGLAISGRHNSAMITDRQKFTANLTLYRCLVFIFTIKINSKFSPGLYKSSPKVYATFVTLSLIRYRILLHNA